MKPRGIPIAQIDSDTELDSKLQKLARSLSAIDYYATFGAYMSIVLRAWGTASRATDPNLLDLIPPEIRNRLSDAGLLDEHWDIPESVFESRVGAVLESRQDRSDQLASIASEGGKARARGPRDPSSGRLLSPAVVQPLPLAHQPLPLDVQPFTSRSSSPLLSSAGDSQENDVLGNDGEVQEGLDDPVVTYYTLTTRYPKGNALAWVKRLGDDHGFARTSGSMHQAWAADDNIGTLLSRAENILVATERTAELAEKADERERLRQKRATRLAPVDVPTPEKAGEILANIRKQLPR
jgi:hypothetical protein